WQASFVELWGCFLLHHRTRAAEEHGEQECDKKHFVVFHFLCLLLLARTGRLWEAKSPRHPCSFPNSIPGRSTYRLGIARTLTSLRLLVVTRLLCTTGEEPSRPCRIYVGSVTPRRGGHDSADGEGCQAIGTTHPADAFVAYQMIRIIYLNDYLNRGTTIKPCEISSFELRVKRLERRTV